MHGYIIHLHLSREHDLSTMTTTHHSSCYDYLIVSRNKLCSKLIFVVDPAVHVNINEYDLGLLFKHNLRARDREQTMSLWWLHEGFTPSHLMAPIKPVHPNKQVKMQCASLNDWANCWVMLLWRNSLCYPFWMLHAGMAVISCLNILFNKCSFDRG